MKAAEITHFGHADAVEIVDVPTPQPHSGEALVEVHASSINPVDIKMREGMRPDYLKQMPLILGCDVAGVLKKDIDGLHAGDRVYGQASVFRGGSGAFAEFATMPRDLIAKMPDNLDFPGAASMVLVGTSAIEALYDHMQLKPGQKILIHGAAGGIGTAAVQIAKHIGATVVATTHGEEVNYVRQLGADEVIDIDKEDFSAKLSGIDAVLDTVGGDTYKRSFKVLKRGGIIVSMLEKPDEKSMKQYGVKAIYEFTQVRRDHLEKLTELLEEGVLLVHVEETYPLDDIREAFEAKENGHVRGKIAIEIQ